MTLRNPGKQKPTHFGEERKHMKTKHQIHLRIARGSTLITLIVIVLLGCSQPVLAQWTTPNASQNINNTNTGNVGIGTTNPGERLVTVGNSLTGNITSHTQLYSTYDSQSNVILELGYGTPSSNVTPLPILVLSKNLTNPNTGLGAISFANSNIPNGSEKRLTGFSTFTDGAINSGALSFHTSAAGVYTERLRITSAGQVGVGTLTPAFRFDVQGGQINASGGLCIGGDCKTAWSQVGGGTINGVTAGTGLTGGGTSGAVTLTNSDRGSSQLIFGRIANAAGTTQFSAASNTDILRFAGSGGTNVTFDPATKKVTIDATNTTGSAANISSGQFGQNTGGGNYTFPGNVTVTGTINAKYQDVAEWVPAAHAMSAGTVAVLNPSQSNQVMASAQAYDTRVAGVISETPGLILGESGQGKVLVATTGRVRVRVDATHAPIAIGDLLVTSDIEGVAMKSEPISVGGAALHRPGTLIGKALEPLAKGQGEILVLLSLQ
jgi:hypothetical protein